MKSWKNLEVLINDYRTALEKQDTVFSKKILSFLNISPEVLVGEFRDHPGTRFVTRKGDWMSLWAGGAKIDGEFYEHKTIINRIKELLKNEHINR